jgi:polyisoprenoid-binding protein YceI
MVSINVVSRFAFTASLMLAVSALAGCDNNPTKDKALATVAEPVAVAAPSAPAAATVKYVFSNADSKVSFVGAKVTRKHDGSFGTFNGTIDLVDGKPEKGAVTVDIDIASLTADEPKLIGHLKSPDLLDAAKFPKAHFASTSVKAGGDKGATHTVTGNLTLHGVTKSISFPATIKMNGDTTDVNAEFGINRKDFGIVYPGMPNDLIKDEILIKLDIHGKKA